jgi:hypothetical protein
MIPAAIVAFALLALDALDARQVTPPTSAQDPFRGSEERVTPPRHVPSAGMTLEALKGLPRTRPVLLPPQPQVWVYQPIVVYPASPYGLGGYRPPGVGGSYYPWGVWWFR